MREHMRPKTILADLGIGLLALAIVIAGYITGLLSENLRDLLFLVSALFFAGGLLRGASPAGQPWFRGLLVALGGTIPVCLMAATKVAFTSHPALAAFAAASVVSAIAGLSVRRSGSGYGMAIAAAWVVAVILVGLLLVPRIVERLSTTRANHPAPAFTFQMIDGRPVTNASLRGRIAVLAFWATWCGPCRQELPTVDALYRRYRNDPRVVFVAVDTEGRSVVMPPAKAQSFLSNMGLSLPLAINGDDLGKFGSSVLPTLVILDPAGRVRLVHAGYDGAEDLGRIVSDQITALRSDNFVTQPEDVARPLLH